MLLLMLENTLQNMQIFQAIGTDDTHFFTQILQISIKNSALFVHKYFIFGMLNSTTKHAETGHVNEAKKSGKYRTAI